MKTPDFKRISVICLIRDSDICKLRGILVQKEHATTAGREALPETATAINRSAFQTSHLPGLHSLFKAVIPSMQVWM